MDVSTYVLLSHEQALRRRLDVVANNMANVNTTGFRREQPVFRELVQQSEGALAPDAKNVSFVLDFGAVHDTSHGAFQATGNPLDLMIESPGYLGVGMPDGTTAYTRAGNLKVLDNGQLGTASGLPIRGEGGAPIAIPPEQAGRITISSDGIVHGTEGPLGRIALTLFADEGALVPMGDTLLSGSGGSEVPATESRLRTGGLESSNVQPIAETTQMVEILRSYQSSQRMSDSLGDMRRQALGRLGRLGN